MEHGDLRWNSFDEEWFCAKCGRTSDHVTKQDAEVELEQYKCELPTEDGDGKVPSANRFGTLPGEKKT